MKDRRLSIISCFLAALVIGACSSSPPVRYFSLSPTVVAGEPDDENASALGLGPIRLPEYLNRSQIVTRGVGQELTVDEFNRWAEPMASALHRIVSTDVDNAVDGLVVAAFPWESEVRATVDFRLLGDVVRFDADHTGRVILDVQWSISETASGKIVAQPTRSRYVTQAGSPDDPAAIASAMNEALAKFSRDIAGRMQAVLE